MGNRGTWVNFKHPTYLFRNGITDMEECMTKKNINVTIDAELLKDAREQIPNISSFFESCLRNYLNGAFPVSDANKILQKIGKLQADLYLLNQNNNIQEKIKQKENAEKDKAWRFLWNDYNTRLILDNNLMEKAIGVLGINGETLEDILDWALLTDVKVDTNYWEDVLKKYTENKDEY